MGTVDAGVLGEVDPAGLINMDGCRWSLDWWVGAEDRWHHPGMESTVRQGPLGGSPVRETALRVPGGEVVQRVGGVQASAGEWAGPGLVVEVENLTAVPVALAIVVRPWRLDEPGTLGEVALDGAGGTSGAVVGVDGRPAALLDRMPSRVVHGATAEVAARLAAGEDAGPRIGESWIAGGDGDLEVAFVVPLAHTATVRVLVPAPGPRTRRGRGGPVPALPWTAPALAAVTNGWSVHGGSDPRLVAPLDAWSDLVDWSAHMLRLAGPGEVTRALDPAAVQPAGPDSGIRLVAVAEALAGLDAAGLNDSVAGALVSAQRFSGAVEPADRSDATPALLWAAGAVLRSALGPLRADDLVGPVAKAIRYLSKRSSRAAAGLDGVDGLRVAAALRSVAGGLAAVGQPEVAQDALVLAARLGEPAVPAPDATLPGGTGSTSTFALARADRDALAVGSTRGIEHLVERVPLRRVEGVADADDRPRLGFDVAELAETRCTLLDAMVTDGPRGPVLLPVWPPEWNGRSVEAHDVPTAWGTVSFALRWHGRHPALLWEVTPWVGTNEGRAAPSVQAPGLDPGFAGAEWSGEALLGDGQDRVGGSRGDSRRGESAQSASGQSASRQSGSGQGDSGPVGEGDSFG